MKSQPQTGLNSSVHAAGTRVHTPLPCVSHRACRVRVVRCVVFVFVCVCGQGQRESKARLSSRVNRGFRGPVREEAEEEAKRWGGLGTPQRRLG